MTYAEQIRADKRFPPLKRRETHAQKVARLCALIRHMALVGGVRSSGELEAYLALRREVLGF